MKTIEQQGKTVDDAINQALEQLEVSRDQISVEILEEGSRGLFGLMGSKPAKIRVNVNQETTYTAIKEELQSVQTDGDSRRREKRSAAAKEASPPKEYDEANVQHIVSTAKDALSVLLRNLQVLL